MDEEPEDELNDDDFEKETPNKIKKHPAYLEAVSQIIKIFNDEGYGAVIKDVDFDRFMSIPPPPTQLTYMEWQSLQMERLQKYEAIEHLLDEYDICLIRKTRQGGFVILHPRDQIIDAFDKRIKRAMRELDKAAQAVRNCRSEALSSEEQLERDKRMLRAAFIKTAMKKRKLSIVPADETKKLRATG